MDPFDALADTLTRKLNYRSDVPDLLSRFDTIKCGSRDSSSIFRDVLGYSPLQYAIQFSCPRIPSLLASGEDAAAEPLLAYAVCTAPFDVIKPLVDAGVDANMRDKKGRTALHWACQCCFYAKFHHLLRWAGDQIDWNARTPEGQTALDLFENGLEIGLGGHLSPQQVVEFRSDLTSRIDNVSSSDEELSELRIPGSFYPQV